jgi:hypothetical protein
MLAAWQANRSNGEIQKLEIERELAKSRQDANFSNAEFYQHELAKEKVLEQREFHQLHKEKILKLEAQREAIFDQWDEDQSSDAVCQYETARVMLLSEMSPFDVAEGNLLADT